MTYERSSQTSEQREPLGFIWVLPVGHTLQGNQGLCRLLVRMTASEISHEVIFEEMDVTFVSKIFFSNKKHISLTQLLSIYLVSSKSK